MEPIPSFLDFEASSLSPQSYPIEIAWSMGDGSVESYLISPDAMESWTDWDPEAERIHGIPRAYLLANGHPPAYVCGVANQRLRGRIVYCDAPDFDGMWLAKLFAACGDQGPRFELKHADELILSMISSEPFNLARSFQKIGALKIEARKQKPLRHRASWDVEYLIRLWQLARAEVSQP